MIALYIIVGAIVGTVALYTLIKGVLEDAHDEYDLASSTLGAVGISLVVAFLWPMALAVICTVFLVGLLNPQLAEKWKNK